MKDLRALLPLLAILLAGCSSFRWSGSPPETGRPASAAMRSVDNNEGSHSPATVDEGMKVNIATTTAPGAQAPAPK